MSIVILALISLIITLPLFLADGLIASYDIFFHFIWSEQFYKALAEGVLYPRWVDTPFGYGSPTFIFYAPLSFYVISLLNFLTNSHIMSIKIAIYLSFFLSGLTMYLFAKRLNGQNAGLISGVLYQLIPYHVFDFLGRGVVPELFAFIWFPLILLFMREIFIDRRHSSMIYMSLAYAGLIMTHLVSSFMFTFVMVGYGIYLTLAERKKGMLRMLCAMAIGLGLSSVYLLPVIFERGFVHIESIQYFNYGSNFLFLQKTLLKEPMNRVALVDAVFLIVSLILAKRILLGPRNAFFVMLPTISLFLTISLSSFVWRNMQGFSSIQFPWRWLVFSGLSLSLTAGYAVVNSRENLQKALCLILLLPLLLSFLIMFRPPVLADLDFWKEQSVAFAPFEYRPIWLRETGKMLPATERVAIIKGTGSVDIVDWKSTRRILSAHGDTALTLRISTFFYPGWVAKVDARKTIITIDEDSGSMITEVPEGNHKVELTFENTPIRSYGKVISVFSFLVISAVYSYAIFKRPKSKVLRQ
jgi:hypothetical protein